MSYATVMVSLALDQPNEARLEAACQIAERFDAGVVGIAASQFSPPLYFTSGEQAQNLIDQGQAALTKRMSELEAQFLGAASEPGEVSRMAQRHRLSGAISAAARALRRHHRQRRA